MAVIQVDLKNAGKEFRKLMDKNAEDIKDAVVSGCYKSMSDIVRISPVDTGLFASSWQLTEEENSVLIGNFAPHAPIIEFGARPFTPPLGPLLAWAKRVLQDPSQPGDYSSQVWALAKYTQEKISLVGMEPKAILQQSIPVIIENIKQELRAL